MKFLNGLNIKRDEIKKFQEKKIREIVEYCYNKIPFYRKKFNDVNLKPQDIKTFDDFKKVPFTTKQDLRDNYPFKILAVNFSEIVRIHASSGTTGKPTVITYTKKDLTDWINLMARCLYVCGVKKGDVVQNAYGYGLFTGGLGFHYGTEALGTAIIPTSTGNTKRQIMIMKDMGTTVLFCTPSYAIYLIECAKKQGINPKNELKIRIGVFGAEPWSEAMRKTIEDGFGLEAFDMYGMSELYGPGVAIECKKHNGLHVWEDFFYVEVIDPKTGETIEYGKGELVFTTLQREGMPLLRYRTRDLSEIIKDKCNCGIEHVKIARIQGRSDDMLIVSGVNVFPSQIEHVIGKIDELSQHYQIIVDRDILDKLSIKIEVKENVKLNEKLKKRVEEELRAVLQIKSNVELLPFGTLPRTEGKAKRIVDLRKI